MSWIARRDGKFRWRFSDHLHDPMAIKKNFLTLDLTSGILKNSERFRIQKLDSNVFQDGHRPFVDGFNTFLGQRLNWAVCVFHNAPRHLLNRPAIATGISSTSSAPASWGITHHHLQRLLAFKMPEPREVCGQIATFSV
jgi:hypothetical protein